MYKITRDYYWELRLTNFSRHYKSQFLTDWARYKSATNDTISKHSEMPVTQHNYKGEIGHNQV